MGNIETFAPGEPCAVVLPMHKVRLSASEEGTGCVLKCRLMYIGWAHDPVAQPISAARLRCGVPKPWAFGTHVSREIEHSTVTKLSLKLEQNEQRPSKSKQTESRAISWLAKGFSWIF